MQISLAHHVNGVDFSRDWSLIKSKGVFEMSIYSHEIRVSKSYAEC